MPEVVPTIQAIPTYIPHLAFCLETIEGTNSLEEMSMDIVVGRYTATFVGDTADQDGASSLTRDAQYIARERLRVRELTEVNVHARIPKDKTIDFLQITGVDVFLTSSPYLFRKAHGRVPAYLLAAEHCPDDLRGMGLGVVTSVEQFVTSATLPERSDTRYRQSA